MMSGILRKVVVVPILVAFFLVALALPNPALAKWDDKSGDLEGGDSTGLLIVVGVLVVATVVYIVIKSGGDDEDAEDQSLANPEETLEPVSLRMERAEAQPNLRLGLGLPAGEDGTVTLKGVQMGVSLEF